MTDLVNVSDFSYSEGVNIGGDNKSFTYMYGLSDFWQYLFQDTSPTNLLIEATSLQAADIYSKFLQLSSGLSIADISNSASSQLMLEIINDQAGTSTSTTILNGTWGSGFTTIQVVNTTGFAVGDVISVSGIQDLTTYNVGDGVNTNSIDAGGLTSVISGAYWNGTFIITSVGIGGYITYYQSNNPGIFTSGGVVYLASMGVETYSLTDRIVSSRFITNRPFLPTITLEEGVDFSIDSTTSRVSFAQKLSSYGFPVRKTSTGATEYSLWFADVRYDEDLIYSNFSLLLGIQTTSVSNEQFRNFLYGLYYIYTSGPTLSVIEKGINLILGIPLARGSETVLDIRNYVGSNQVMIITDLNSYLLPVGINSIVSIGQTLEVGDELAKWVEIIDNQSQVSWWNSFPIEIPPELMPVVPAGQTRLVTGDPGNYANWIMTKYLGRNMFLVKANVSATTFINAQQFENISYIITKLKPNHTTPVYYYNSITPLVSVFTRGTVGLVGNNLTVSILGNTTATAIGVILP